jgi:D-alanyl-D-alanine carboxypeptidase.
MEIDLYPKVIALRNILYESVYKATGMKMRMTSGLRTIEEQEKLYAIGRTIVGKNPSKSLPMGEIVTRAIPGHSFHNYGLAFDSCFIGDDPYLEKMSEKDSSYIWNKFGDLVVSTGHMFWGGNFKTIKDLPHAEKRYGLTTCECMDIVKSHGLVGFYQYLDTIADKWP